MKRLLIYICTFLFIFFSNNTIAQEKVKDKEDKTKMKADKTKQPVDGMTMTSSPYTANYSSNFAIGNPNHSKMILDLWKDWDDNAFERHDYFADTMMMILPDGQVLKGKAAIVEGGKKVRDGFTSATSTLDAWIPLKSLDKNEDWVAMWGQEEDVLTDGSKQKREIHEIWRINKDGKVDFMKQWTATPPPPAK